MVEEHAAIVCACLTTIKPLLNRIFPNLLASDEVASPDPEERRQRAARRGPSLDMDTVHSDKSAGNSSAGGPGAGPADLEKGEVVSADGPAAAVESEKAPA